MCTKALQTNEPSRARSYRPRFRLVTSRRTLTVGLAATLIAPRRSAAQPSGKPRTVGVFGAVDEDLYKSFVTALRDLGWVDGQNVVITRRRVEGASGVDVDELIRLAPDVIFVSNPLRIKLATERTKTIPIVGYDLESDPVASGFVKSLARPGGNVTGIWLDLPELAGKLIQLLQEVVQRLTLVAVLWDDRIGNPQFTALQAAARTAGIGVHAVTLHEPGEAGAAMQRVLAERPQGLVLLTSPSIYSSRARIAELAMRGRLPSISLFSPYPEAGGLMAYGPDHPDNYRLAARVVDRILRGSRPADVPVERPSKFELVINVKTAKALGVTIPQAVLLRADRVIE